MLLCLRRRKKKAKPGARPRFVNAQLPQSGAQRIFSNPSVPSQYMWSLRSATGLLVLAGGIAELGAIRVTAGRGLLRHRASQMSVPPILEATDASAFDDGADAPVALQPKRTARASLRNTVPRLPTYSAESIAEWRQYDTLQEPPFKPEGPWGQIISEGHFIGDPMLDVVASAPDGKPLLYGVAAGKKIVRVIPKSSLGTTEATPTVEEVRDWVRRAKESSSAPCSDLTEPLSLEFDDSQIDYARVEQGQQAWSSRVGESVRNLGLALMSGFAVRRAVEVLEVNPRTTTPKGALARYDETGFYWQDWLQGGSWADPYSSARMSAESVRCFHALGRTNDKVWEKWVGAPAEVVPKTWRVDRDHPLTREVARATIGGRNLLEANGHDFVFVFAEAAAPDETELWDYFVPLPLAADAPSVHDLVERFPLFRKNGVPINQYDLAETLFTFATVPIMVTESSVVLNPRNNLVRPSRESVAQRGWSGPNIAQREKSDMVYMWGAVAHHLGLTGTANFCHGLPDPELAFTRYSEEWNVFNAQRYRTQKWEVTKKVQDPVIVGAAERLAGAIGKQIEDSLGAEKAANWDDASVKELAQQIQRALIEQEFYLPLPVDTLREAYRQSAEGSISRAGSSIFELVNPFKQLERQGKVNAAALSLARNLGTSALMGLSAFAQKGAQPAVIEFFATFSARDLTALTALREESVELRAGSPIGAAWNAMPRELQLLSAGESLPRDPQLWPNFQPIGAFLPSLLPRDEEAMKAPYKGWLAARQKSAFESTEAKLRALESACVVSAAGTSCLDDADGEPAGESTV